MDGNELLDALQKHRDRKKARVAPPSAYRSVKSMYLRWDHLSGRRCMVRVLALGWPL
jgi:hypothetical protein